MGRITYVVRDRIALWDGKRSRDWVPGIVDAVVEHFDPQQMVLFGSVAQGTEGPDSDIDLLVVFDHADPANRRRLMREVRRVTRHIAAPHDLAVTDVATYARDCRRPGTIEHEAATTGTVMYERATG